MEGDNKIPVRPALVTNVVAGMHIVPVAKNMMEFKKTALFASRQKLYANHFTPMSKTYQYPDDAKTVALKVDISSNPPFSGQQTNNVQAKQTAAPPTQADPAGQTCVTQHIQLTADSTSFLINDFSAQAAHLFPGAIFTWDDFASGSYKEVAGARNPMVLNIDLPNLKPGASSFVTVTDPAMNTVDTAVAELFARAASGPAANESTVYQVYQSYTSSDLNLKISGGIGGYGMNFSNVFNSAQKDTHRHMTIDASKTLFSINTIPPDNGFFTDPKVEGTPNLIAMCNVSYGVRVLANIDIEFNSSTDADKFSAHYSGFGMTVDAGLEYFNQNSSTISTINAYITGGPSNGKIAMDAKSLKAEIDAVLQGATYQNARPISYQFFDMAGNIMGTQSNTEFQIRQCVPAKVVQSLQSVFVTFNTSDDNKDDDTAYTISLNTLGNQVAAKLVDNNRHDEYDENSGITKQLPVVNSNLVYTDFLGRGGHVVLTIDPNGHDTWNMSTLKLTMTFKNNPTPVPPIVFSKVHITQDNKTLTLYFDGNFKPM